MSILRWIGLLAIVIVCWTALRPQVSTPPADPTTGHATASSSTTIDALTQAERVADWLVQHQRLPDFYLTKAAARRQGWEPDKGNLCEVLPGRAIGGDRFSNREQQLPRQAGRQWYEADVNYRCGRRGADRLIYSSDGLIYLTRDHYRSFRKVH